MFNATHGKHISVWELREVQEYHTGKTLLSLMPRDQIILFFLSLCLSSKCWLNFIKYALDIKMLLLCEATQEQTK